MSTARTIGLAMLALLSTAVMVGAQDPEQQNAAESPLANLSFTEGPGSAAIGNIAAIDLSSDYHALGQADTRRLLEALGNLTEGDELALVAPKEHLDWFVVFEWDACGYVKDDESDLDGDAILQEMKDNESEVNEQRKRAGLAPQKTLRWAIEPHYDSRTNNLEWAFVFEEGGVETVNLNTRRLGRRGVMRVTLVCDPQALEETLPLYHSVMDGFRYTPDNAYAAYRKGDKVAEYTLGALVGGGALAVAAKLGFFKKFWKLILLGVGGVVAFFGKLFRRNRRAAPEGPAASS